MRAERDGLVRKLREMPEGETYDQALQALDELETGWQALLHGLSLNGGRR